VRVSRIGVAAVRHHLGLEFLITRGRGISNSQQCDDEFITPETAAAAAAIIAASLIYESKVGNAEKLSVIT